MAATTVDFTVGASVQFKEHIPRKEEAPLRVKLSAKPKRGVEPSFAFGCRLMTAVIESPEWLALLARHAPGLTVSAFEVHPYGATTVDATWEQGLALAANVKGDATVRVYNDNAQLVVVKLRLNVEIERDDIVKVMFPLYFASVDERRIVYCVHDSPPPDAPVAATKALVTAFNELGAGTPFEFLCVGLATGWGGHAAYNVYLRIKVAYVKTLDGLTKEERAVHVEQLVFDLPGGLTTLLLDIGDVEVPAHELQHALIMSHGSHSCLQAGCQARFAAYSMPSLPRHGPRQCLTPQNYQRLGGSCDPWGFAEAPAAGVSCTTACGFWGAYADEKAVGAIACTHEGADVGTRRGGCF